MKNFNQLRIAKEILLKVLKTKVSRKTVIVTIAATTMTASLAFGVVQTKNDIAEKEKLIKTTEETNEKLNNKLMLKEDELDKTIKQKDELNDSLYNSNQEIKELQDRKQKLEQERDQLKKDLQSKKDREQKVASTSANQTSSTTTRSSNKKNTSTSTQSKSGMTLLGSFNASAYTTDPAENGGYVGLTAMGTSLHQGVVAVDPSVIPLGSKVYIAYPDGTPYGYGSAEDTGGAIKGKKIDICVGSSKSAARTFGRRQMNVYLVK